MRLAAIYIKQHGYLFSEPQTINFGGKYYYNFENNDDAIIIKRTINNNFIENFFDLTQIASGLTNINAIVGQNGAGKSAILDIIRSQFIKNEYALPSSKTLFLVEMDNNRPFILKSDFDDVSFIEKNKTKKKIILNKITYKKIQTIYYSPHFDYKYNPKFDDVDDHEISFDKIVEKDLTNLNEIDTNDHGWSYTPTQELLFKNSLRQIEFLSSDLVAKQKIFQDVFQFQEQYDPILYFMEYKKREKEWNTPYQLRRILKLINDKLEDELNNWHLIQKFEKGIITN